MNEKEIINNLILENRQLEYRALKAENKVLSDMMLVHAQVPNLTGVNIALAKIKQNEKRM